MELKEYLKILGRDKLLFVGVILATIVISFCYFAFRADYYETSITLNITRIGSQETSDFKYDGFYRLQADDKFAETVVEWLKSPRIISDIYKEAGLDTENYNLQQLTKAMKPEKMSSQLITVRYSAGTCKNSEDIAQAISHSITNNTQELNNNQQESAWFDVIAEEPVIKKHKNAPITVGAISLLIGTFISFWIVMFKHYLR